MTMTSEHRAILKKAVAVSGAGKATAILKANSLWDEAVDLRKWEFQIEETLIATVVIAAATKEEARRWVEDHCGEFSTEDYGSDFDVSFIRERDRNTHADEVVEQDEAKT